MLVWVLLILVALVAAVDFLLAQRLLGQPAKSNGRN